MDYSRTRTRPLQKTGTKSGGSSETFTYPAKLSWSWTKTGGKKAFLGKSISIPPGIGSKGNVIVTALDIQYIQDQMWAAYMDYYAPRAQKYAKSAVPPSGKSYTVWSEESFSDTPTWGFKKLSAAGEVIVTDCYKTSHVIRQQPVVAPLEVVIPTERRFEGGITAEGGTLELDPSFSFSSFVAEMPEDVAEYFWSLAEPSLDVDMSTVSDAYGNMQAFDFQNLVDLGEFRETLGTVTKSARGIANIYRQLRRGNFKRFAKQTAKEFADGSIEDKAQAISDAWLEARFAWRPLILTAMDAVKRIREDRPRTPRRTFRAKHEQVTTSEFVHTAYANGILYEYVGTRTESCVNRSGILAAVDTSMGHSELQAELGLYDLAGTAWELVPYSFVVDWFVNINGLLYSICPSPVFKALGSWLTTKSSVEISGVVKCTVGGRSATGTFSVHRSTMQRLANPQLPAIAWNPNLNFGKLLDAVSLLKRFVIFR